MFPPSFAYDRPRTLDEALELLAEYRDEARVLAGGHSLLPSMKLREVRPRRLVDVNRLSELAGDLEVNGAVVIPSLTRHADVAASAAVGAAVPLLVDLAGRIGDPQVRNAGTVGGAAAEIYAGSDWAPALVVTGAVLHCRSRDSEREIPAAEQFASDEEVALRPDEIVTRIEVPIPGERVGGVHVRLERRAGLAVCNCSAQVTLDDAGRYEAVSAAWGGLGTGPVVASRLSELLVGWEPDNELHRRAATEALRVVEPLSDVRGSADYRRKVGAVVLARALDAATRRARGETVEVRDVV